jgi:hypothetical protein
MTTTLIKTVVRESVRKQINMAYDFVIKEPTLTAIILPEFIAERLPSASSADVKPPSNKFGDDCEVETAVTPRLTSKGTN